MSTQGASSPSSPSSSSCPRPWTSHHVFLSFRGIDTRDGFTNHLYNALVKAEIKTFMDDYTLSKGEDISEALLEAIESAKISVIIFSENYAASSWCLDELVKILQCKKSNKQRVMPVFYKVDPRDVRRQRGKFGEPLNELQHNKEKEPRWRAALTEASKLLGWHYQKGYESDTISEIVKAISEHLNIFRSSPPPSRKCNPSISIQNSYPNGRDRSIVIKNPLNDLESICPPGGEDKIVLYTTTLAVVRTTFEACNEVRAAIEKLGFVICERDLSWEHEGYLKELRELMKGKGREATVPQLFVKGRYVGGSKEVLKMVEEARLGQILEGLPRKRAG
ncbi:hypothetical protein M0R45_034386 [Rubus argutus]|uniref:TIR domain-containing protein n=1 Tax=Rubus argutus TaxID=59490 RepID=A0AAW1VSE0_RUBAR